jgi:hypothetical protein
MLNRLSSYIALALSHGLFVGTLAVLNGCSSPDADAKAASASTTTSVQGQAQAAQSALAAARSANDQHIHDGTTASDAGGPAASNPAMPAGGSADTGDPPMNMKGSSGGASTGMSRMLGQPPMMGAPAPKSDLPAALGAPHIYHIGAETFFVDQASAIGLTSQQQSKLAALKESATLSYATTQRKIDQAEQDLWVLTSAEKPDSGKIEAKIGEITRLGGQQRMDFLRTVGEAVAVLNDVQRKAVVSQSGPMQPGSPAGGSGSMNSSGSGMGMGNSGMGMGNSGMGMGNSGMGMGNSGMGMGNSGMGMGKDAGPSTGGMGHM